jgi:glycosyltransferase involved in cell wall biosynthesis
MKILYIIDWAGISGGAEMIVANSIVTLPGDIHMAYFWKQDQFNFDNFPGVTFWNIDKNPSWKTIAKSVRKVKKIIIENNIEIVFSHLYWSNTIARLATPNNVRLFTCMHNIETKASLKKKYLQILENLVYRKSETTFCVSNAVATDYKSIVRRAKTVILYNFIKDIYFQNQDCYIPFTKKHCKILCVGYIKPQKNYDYLLRVFLMLKNQNILNIEMDVFGGGEYLSHYIELSKTLGININFKGEHFSIEEIIKEYDLFILASYFEGFGIATLEAMASKIPVFLSDIPVNREVTSENAIFFDLGNPSDAVDKLIAFSSGKLSLEETVANAYLRASEIAQKKFYLQKLFFYFNL